VTPPIAHFLKQKTIATNLCIMVITWTTTVSNFYMLFYLVNQLNNVYASALAVTFSDVIAISCSGVVMSKLGVSKSLKSCMFMATTGGVILLAWGLNHQESVFFLIILFLAKMGIAASTNILYLSHPLIFPTLFATTAFGFCNIPTRIATSAMPMLARTDQPTPILYFTITSAMTCLCLFRLRLSNTQEFTNAVVNKSGGGDSIMDDSYRLSAKGADEQESTSS
jgi:hypothetical protein